MTLQPSPVERVQTLLTFLYDEEVAMAMLPSFESTMTRTQQRLATRAAPREISEKDVLLIAYGDSVQSPGERPLQTLRRFLVDELGDLFTGVHILPFYPYTSDDGFSVVDYRAIDPALGTWSDIDAICKERRVMFDAVVNHISQSSDWFQGFLRNDEPWRDYFIDGDPAVDLSQVVRPRTSPLLTPVATQAGERHVWTTFSADQIDLNFANPQVAFEIADLLLFYAEQGADLIRLDAIAYLWKEPGTRSIHLPQTHAMVKLLRATLDGAAPHVSLITETNVPHADNISYFGAPLPARAIPEGISAPRSDEAQLVYQFPLAPLILHTFATGNASVLTKWASKLDAVPGSFFNFTASHDGIGVLPALGYLSMDAVLSMAARAETHGGRVSYRSLPDGSQTPYELNCTFYDILNNPERPSDLDIPRFLATQAIMLALAGLPGIYMQSLFGARNCHSCLEATGRARSLNREKFDYDELIQRLGNPQSREHRVYSGYKRLLALRREHPAFHPASSQRIVAMHDSIFAVLREAQGTTNHGAESIFCLTNVTGTPLTIDTPMELTEGRWHSLQDGSLLSDSKLHLAPFQVIWFCRSG